MQLTRSETNDNVLRLRKDVTTRIDFKKGVAKAPTWARIHACFAAMGDGADISLVGMMSS